MNKTPDKRILFFALVLKRTLLTFAPSAEKLSKFILILGLRCILFAILFGAAFYGLFWSYVFMEWMTY